MHAKAQDKNKPISNKKNRESIPSCISIVVIIVVLLAFSYLLLFGNAKVPASQAAPATNLEHETIKVQYFYADWCNYCENTSNQLDSLAPLMGGQLIVERLDESDRGKNSTLSQIYADYKKDGTFGGFPTLVAHGPNGKSSLVGYRSINEVKDWLCSQFVNPPKTCEN